MAIFASKSGSVSLSGLLSNVVTAGAPNDGDLLIWSDALQAFEVTASSDTSVAVTNITTFGGANVYTLAGQVAGGTLTFKEVRAGTGIALSQTSEILTITNDQPADMLSVTGNYRITIDNDNTTSDARFDVYTSKSSVSNPTTITFTPTVSPPLTVNDIYSGIATNRGYFETQDGTDLVSAGFAAGQFLEVENGGSQTGSWQILSVTTSGSGPVISRITLVENFTGSYANNLGGPKQSVKFTQVEINATSTTSIRAVTDDFGVAGHDLSADMNIVLSGSKDGTFDGTYVVESVTSKGAGDFDYSTITFTAGNPLPSTGHIIPDNETVPALQFDIQVYEESTGFYVVEDGTMHAVSASVDNAPTADAHLTRKDYVDALLQTNHTENLISVSNGGLFIVDGVGVANSVNYLQIGNSASGDDITITAIGTDTDINLSLSGKGTGLVIAPVSYDMSSGDNNAFATKGYVDTNLSTASNLAGGDEDVFSSKVSNDLQFKSLTAGTNISLSSDGNTITIGTTSSQGEANTASNLAGDEGIYSSKSSVDLRFKSITAGTNVTLSSDANAITINASAQTGAEIKALYELETSAFTDGQFTKLAGIETTAKDDQAASEVPFSATGNIVATDVQAALAELDTEKLALTGGTLSGLLTLSGAPSTSLHAATKQYVDNVASGLDAKDAVRAATTANITLSDTQTIDAVNLNVGDRVLAKNQTDQTENGIWLVQTGPWVRTVDADNSPSNEVSGGMYTLVSEGGQGGNGFVLSSPDGDANLGVDNLIFTQFSSSASAVGSVFGRTGAVVAVIGDYAASEVSNDSSVSGTYVSNALNTLDAKTYEDLVGSNTLTIIDGVSVSSAVNRLQVTNSTAGNDVLISVTGSDNDIDLRLNSKGAGKVVIDNARFGSFVETEGGATQVSSTLMLNMANGHVFTHTLTEALTDLVIVNVPTGGTVSLTLILTNSNAPDSFNLGTIFTETIIWAGGITPTLTATADAVDIFTFVTTNGGSSWIGLTGGQDFS